MNGDGREDLLLSFSLCSLLAQGNLSASTTEIRVWGWTRRQGDTRCGTVPLTVVGG